MSSTLVPPPRDAAPVSLPAQEPVLYDFRRPTTLSREHARTLELAFETFARQWGTQLTARVRVMSQVTLESVTMQTYDDYIARLPATTAMVLCSLDGLNARAVFQFPASGALNWVSHILGSHHPVDVPERKFTRIEQTLVRNLVTETLEDLHYSLGGLLKSAVTVDTIHYNAQFAQAATKMDLMLAATFTIQVGDRSVLATVAVPGDAILPQLGEENPIDTGEHAAELLNEHIAQVPMELALSVSDAQVTPEQILNMSVGDVLRLPHPSHRPLNLTVDGQRLGTAAAGSHAGRIAAVVVSTEESTL
ncbi:flagellar motor switch protein FliM [Nesterenkonia lutea]|uniref:Flagellar motor switch protein FliM n=1 Tax=Nesterenkonia lutea TaxID=272919 RepID=A0ABR9JFS4_9MICC|nr:flagellar motor switch protein FliM [Nesterenkonia lutea]MBE1524623.1 flagellar motor switch protein FliM [Nesterenkonia lutea]